MNLSIRQNESEKIIELGGGANPVVHPRCLGGPDLNVDVRDAHLPDGRRTVDFTADFNEPLPISTGEFDVVVSRFAIEHLSWRKVRPFIGEMLRILKPGGRCIVITANTEAQLQWVKDHPEGWDGKDGFDSISEIIFGSQDYADNTHKNWMTPDMVSKLFRDAGFSDLLVQPFGERGTDMVIEANRPQGEIIVAAVDKIEAIEGYPASGEPAPKQPEPNPIHKRMAEDGEFRKEVFGKDYFNGGGRYGGYANEGMRDFPVHEITARMILARKPESVLELGCGRGYILKRLQDAGIPGAGLEISRHCWMTRVCEGITNYDLCDPAWPVSPYGYDLCYSVAVLEHIPEEHLPIVFAEMARVSKRGLHGIDFGRSDDGFDKTHCTLRDKAWWDSRLPPGHEAVDKELLEKGAFPEEVLKGDGKLKLNVGSFTTMFHHGWKNIDIHPLQPFAQPNRYDYLQHDVRQGLPFGTGTVDAIFSHHMLEHLTYKEGMSFLRECRRVLKRDGAMRIAVPDAGLLMGLYHVDQEPGEFLGRPGPVLSDFDEINDGAAESPTAAMKLWSLLCSGHAACYDAETLLHCLKEAGFDARETEFRENVHSTSEQNTHPAMNQILRETLEMTFGGLSLFAVAVPHFVGESVQ